MNITNTFIVGFEGTILTDDLREKLVKLQPAGIILFDTNIASRDQLKALICDLKDLLGEDLLISIDQEGGKVERLRKISPSLVSLYALAKASQGLTSTLELDAISVENLQTHSKLLALDLVDLGINLVFAPCADLNSNPKNPIIGTRSLGENSELITKQLQVIISELKKYPILHCIKHFPGHGDASIDSHLALPKIDLSEASNYEKHIKPFQTLINDGVDSVMVAHASFERFDNESCQQPASINQPLIKDFLVEKLGFENLIISDEITMKALSDYGDYKQLSKKLLLAGNHLIIWNTNIDEALQSLDIESDSHLDVAISNSLNKVSELKKLLRERMDNFQFPDNYSKSIQELSSKQNKFMTTLFVDQNLSEYQNPDLILCFEHHKLEAFVFEKVFPGVDFKIFNTETEIETSDHKKVLIFSFLAFNDIRQRQQIQKIKQCYQQSIEIACDYPDEDADINLMGFNEAHLKALLSF